MLHSDNAILLQWLKRVVPGSRDVTVTSRSYLTLEKGVGRVDVIMTSSGSVRESRLVLDDVTDADAGLYICSLSTSDGHVSSAHAYLTVYPGTLATTRINPFSTVDNCDILFVLSSNFYIFLFKKQLCVDFWRWVSGRFILSSIWRQRSSASSGQKFGSR